MTPKVSTQLQSIAIHESGHAVACFFENVTFECVTIIPSLDWLGAVRLEKHDLLPSASGNVTSAVQRDKIERHVVVMLAGAIANRKHQPRSRWLKGASGDLEYAGSYLDCLALLDKKHRKLYEALLWRRTEVLIEERWSAIEILADALMRSRTLRLDEANEIIGRHYNLRIVNLSIGQQKRRDR